MPSRQYFLKCKWCNCEIFNATQSLSVKNEEDWNNLETRKYLCHDGFGWELEDFTFQCTECESTEIIVDWRSIEDPVEETKLELRPHILEGSNCGSILGSQALALDVYSRIGRKIAVYVAPLALIYATRLLLIPGPFQRLARLFLLPMLRFKLWRLTRKEYTRSNLEFHRDRILASESGNFPLFDLFPWL